MTIQYSVVIPLKNEEDNIVELIEELEPIMLSLKKPWELICVDDGSTDQTLALLTHLLHKKNYLKLLIFKENYGQSSAFAAGFKAAKGEFVITLDGDRQNDPADIPKLVEAINNCDLVCGVRVNRKDPLSKKLISTVANLIRRSICEDGVSDTGCSLKIYRTSALHKIKMYNGMHRFLPALFKIEGLEVQEVAVNHRERIKGKTKYNFFNRSFNTIADLAAVRWMKKRQLKYQINKELP
ncbi:Undecaprenyl-phosphate 4-deoxy-4-formamido-L-arabinose transferase [Neochlamydia sp. TUME1]|uniref:glycosyltransferase n=1 Tax=unclassified Neochlamydia TaxID=2643326 RepID=UPI00057E52D8|nr:MULTISPECIES: glycosyltransferase [unclassified Neochlamydia]KIC73805.1 Undecaprenyl-phosphate 4-deoxy-4-formamido-L-arabinose transferase [Neochlamydia sp. TUME1]BBI16331.1 UDP-phosphate 4-deoxy-4-formamido-L-arabinosetransferase [Neochlamydia sp. S13]